MSLNELLHDMDTLTLREIARLFAKDDGWSSRNDGDETLNIAVNSELERREASLP
ncbi:MAG: hypothetical protein WA197_06605 [Candidatus Acidiferrales bacterium]